MNYSMDDMFDGREEELRRLLRAPLTPGSYREVIRLGDDLGGPVALRIITGEKGGRMLRQPVPPMEEGSV